MIYGKHLIYKVCKRFCAHIAEVLDHPKVPMETGCVQARVSVLSQA